MCGMVGKGNVRGLCDYVEIEHNLFPWAPGSKNAKNEGNQPSARTDRIPASSCKERRGLAFVTGAASAHPGLSNHPSDGGESLSVTA